MSEIKILKKDEKFFSKEMSHTKLVGYFKTKDNSLRIAFFENDEFVAFETPKAEGTFISTVLEQDSHFELKNTNTVFKSNGNVEYVKYTGVIKKDSAVNE